MMDCGIGVPLAYFITFSTFGTWLHGDARGSIDRNHNQYRAPMIRPNASWQAYERRLLTRPPVTLDEFRRRATRQAIRETCIYRGWHLYALNVRTKHVHAVVTAGARPERVVSVFKAVATQAMRSSGCWALKDSPWSRGGSTRYVWNEASLERVIVYVNDSQGRKLDPDI